MQLRVAGLLELSSDGIQRHTLRPAIAQLQIARPAPSTAHERLCRTCVMFSDLTSNEKQTNRHSV